MLFRKCGCLVGPENSIFRKSISFDWKKYALTTEIHFRSYFHFKWFPDRERERERERERGRRGSPDHAFDVAGEPWAPVQWLHAPDRTDLVDRTTPLDLTFPRSRLQPTDLSLCVILISVWFWFLLLLWLCGGGVLVVVAFDYRSLLSWVELEFRWCVVLGVGYDLFCGLGFGCDFEIFCNKICLDAEKIAEKMWKICKKIAFSE